LEPPLQVRKQGNRTVSCRISAEAMQVLERHAAAAATTPARLAARMLLRELGIAEK
jgi:hypothetical protein